MTTAKFGFCQLTESLYDMTLDGTQDWTIGDSEWHMGWNAGFDYNEHGYENLTNDDGTPFTGPAIIKVDDQGFVTLWVTSCEDGAPDVDGYEQQREFLERIFDEWLDSEAGY